MIKSYLINLNMSPTARVDGEMAPLMNTSGKGRHQAYIF